MKIRVKIGEVEIEYSEPTETTSYPKCTSTDKTDKIEGANTKHDALLKTIKEMAETAVSLHEQMY